MSALLLAVAILLAITAGVLLYTAIALAADVRALWRVLSNHLREHAGLPPEEEPP